MKVLSSRLEGGANVLSEAIASSVPVLASRIPGSVGILEEDYPGYFPPGDTEALAALLERAEMEPDFLRELRSWCTRLASLVDPEREFQSWQSLLEELVEEVGSPTRTESVPAIASAASASATQAERFILIDYDGDPQQDFGREVKAGLTRNPKVLNSRFLYDREGSQLFEEICELPEYYLTRVERSILQQRASEIADLFSKEVTLVELGSGSAAKTRLLMEEFLRRQATLRYVPVDISRTMLEESSRALLVDFPALEIRAIAGEYHDALRQLNTQTESPKLILWLGSNVGNLDRKEAAEFLLLVRTTMSPQDRLLLGIDLRKDSAIIEKAYDDSAGITAQFSLNFLARINRELGGQFDLTTFQHQAIYNEEIGRVEIYLASTQAQRIRIERLGLEVSFAAGERIHTENSYKYSLTEIDELASASGLKLERQWLDGGRRFSINVFGLGD